MKKYYELHQDFFLLIKETLSLSDIFHYLYSDSILILDDMNLLSCPLQNSDKDYGKEYIVEAFSFLILMT